MRWGGEGMGMGIRDCFGDVVVVVLCGGSEGKEVELSVVGRIKVVR
jgi:hypothetical protein